MPIIVILTFKIGPTATLPRHSTLLKALDFVDNSFAQIIAKLKAKDIYEDSLVVVASKNGQASIDPTKYAKISPDLDPAATGVTYHSLQPTTLLLPSFKIVKIPIKLWQVSIRARFDLSIQDIIYGPQLIAQGFGDPTKDPAVPDIIVRPAEGIIYTDGTAKIAEHGGINEDDRHVACFAHAQHPRPKKFTCPVSASCTYYPPGFGLGSGCFAGSQG